MPKVKTRRKRCDDALGWIRIAIYSHGVHVGWYKTFAGAEKEQREFERMKAAFPKMYLRCSIVQVSEIERWHKSAGVDELERMFSL